ncbi:MAG: TIGR00153 family protein [Gammaproteobacteria bacterium]|nr:TIGR00153 family protein [Gammaproteobacteria bacterium]
MARKSTVFSMFGSSPVKPLQQHMEKVILCTNELIPFFNAALTQDWEEAAKIQQSISKLENDADDLKHELRMKLPSGLMMAMSRRDLLEVLSMQDKVANKSKDIAGLILGRKMAFPKDIGECILELIQRSVDAATQAQTTINELDELVETGFRGREVELVEAMVNRLDELESESDKIEIKVRGMVFEVENDLPPINVMFIYQVIDWAGELADLAQRVGSRFELMLAR